MKNKHLEHPEDVILTEGRQGLRNVLKFLKDRIGRLSVKYDGSPAIVWGTNPENGKFFVGTKSVFNKVRIKINYSHNDIECNHGDKPAVASILHMCFEKLPRVNGIYQGDFIGYGGTDTFRPNTITYKLPEVVEKAIVFAAHTSYSGDTIKDVDASFNNPSFLGNDVEFLNTNAEFTSPDFRIAYLSTWLRLVSNFIKFPSRKEGEEIKVLINRYIREEKELDPIELSKETGYSVSFFNLYNEIIRIKEELMENIEAKANIECSLGEHEGFVMSNEYGTWKLIKRRKFSYANFNRQR